MSSCSPIGPLNAIALSEREFLIETGAYLSLLSVTIDTVIP